MIRFDDVEKRLLPELCANEVDDHKASVSVGEERFVDVGDMPVANSDGRAGATYDLVVCESVAF